MHTDLQCARAKYLMKVTKSTRLLHRVCVTRHLVLRLGVAVNDCVETEVSISHKLQTRFYELADLHSRPRTLRVRTKGVSIATLLKR